MVEDVAKVKGRGEIVDENWTGVGVEFLKQLLSKAVAAL